MCRSAGSTLLSAEPLQFMVVETLPGRRMAIGLALAWLLLLVVHYFLMFAFAGWLGTADDFIPWSLTALLLWNGTRRRLGLPPLTATATGRGVLLAGLLLIGLAVLGVDEGQVPGVPAVPAAVFYLFLPIAIVIAVWGLIVRSVSRRQASDATVA